MNMVALNNIKTIDQNKNATIDNLIHFPVKNTVTNKPEPKSSHNSSEPPHEPVQPIKNVEDIQAVKDFLLDDGLESYKCRDYMMFVININNAVRISDLLKLRIGDILTDDGKIVDQYYIRESKTSKTRYIFFGPSSKEAIQMYLDSLRSYKLSDYLFASPTIDQNGNNKPISRQYAWKIIHKAGEIISKNKEKKLHLGTHSMRKTWGYQKIKQNPDDPMIVAQVSEMYNHSNMNTTYRYLGMDIDEKRKLCTENEL